MTSEDPFPFDSAPFRALPYADPDSLFPGPHALAHSPYSPSTTPAQIPTTARSHPTSTSPG